MVAGIIICLIISTTGWLLYLKNLRNKIKALNAKALTLKLEEQYLNEYENGDIVKTFYKFDKNGYHEIEYPVINIGGEYYIFSTKTVLSDVDNTNYSFNIRVENTDGYLFILDHNIWSDSKIDAKNKYSQYINEKIETL